MKQNTMLERWNEEKASDFIVEKPNIKLEPIKKTTTAKTFNEILKTSKSFSEILKFNPYHGPDGRFTGPGGYTSFTYKPGSSRSHDLAIEREKQKHSFSRMKKELGITDVGLNETHDKQKFSAALDSAIKSNPHGGSVDSQSMDTLKNCKTFLSKNGMAGVAVKKGEDAGDIIAVFKNSNYKEKGVVNDLIITARQNGGTKMDCYGKGLVNMYERCGFVPVARVPFNAEYVSDPVLLKSRPDVYVMMKNTDSIKTVMKKNASKSYKKSSQLELDNLPTLEYDEALAYRDSLLEKQK